MAINLASGKSVPPRVGAIRCKVGFVRFYCSMPCLYPALVSCGGGGSGVSCDAVALFFSDDGGEEKGRGRVRVAAVPTATIPRCCQPPIRLTSTPLATANIAVCKPVILGASVESVQRDPVDISVRVQTGLLNHRCYWRKTKCKQVTTSQKYVLLS